MNIKEYKENNKENIIKNFLFNVFDINYNIQEDKINLIFEDNINILDDSSSNASSLFSETFGELYYNFIIIRKIANYNINFVKKVLSVLVKIVHPNIQLFYGLVIDNSFIKDMYNLECENNSLLDNINNKSTILNNNNNKTIDSNKNNLLKYNKSNTYFNNLKLNNLNCVNVILEYVNGIDLKYFNSVVSTKLDKFKSLFIKLTIIKKIAETIAFLHLSNIPHLMLNGSTVKINYQILEDPESLIYKGNNYLEANLVKITEIGSFFKYSSNMQFTIETQMIYEQSFHSPYILLLFKNLCSFEEEIYSLKRNDFWSFGCLVYELFTGDMPFKNYNYKLNKFNNFNSINLDLKEFIINGFFNVEDNNERNKKESNDNSDFIDNLLNNNYNNFNNKVIDINKINYNQNFFTNFHKENIDNIKYILLEEFNLESQKSIIDSLFSKLFKLFNLCFFGYTKKSNNKSTINSIDDILVIINSMIKNFNELYDIEHPNITNSNSLKYDSKLMPFTHYSINKYLDIVNLNELIQKNKKITSILEEKTKEYNVKENDRKKLYNYQESMILVNNINNINQNVAVNYMYFLHKYNNSRHFAFCDIQNLNNYMLDSVHESMNKNYIDIKSNSNNNNSNGKQLNINDIDYIISYLIFFKDCSYFYSLKKQRLYVSCGKFLYEEHKNTKEIKPVYHYNNYKINKTNINSKNKLNDKNNIISNLNSDSVNNNNNNSLMLNNIKLKQKRISKINVIFTDRYNQNLNFIKIREFKSNNNNNGKLNSNINENNNNKHKQKQFNKNYYIGEIGNTLIKRSKHSSIEIEDYLIIIGGEQDTKCELLDLSTNTSYFIEELNTYHINPILFVNENVLYSLNFGGLLRKFKDIYYSLSIGENEVSNNNTNTNYNLKRESSFNQSLQKNFDVNNDFNQLSDRRKTDINIFKSASIKKSTKSLNINYRNYNTFRLSKKTTSNLKKINSSSNSSNSNIENIMNDRSENIIVLESIEINTISTKTKWQVCKANLEELLLIEPVQFSHYKYIELIDFIYIFGMESLDNLDNNFLYYIKFDIRNLRFYKSKPVPPNSKANILKYSLLLESQIIKGHNCFYFYNFNKEKLEVLSFKDISI